MTNKKKIDFHFTFMLCSVHDPDAIKTAGEPALLWVMEFCTGLCDGRICDVPPIACDCGCVAEIDKIDVNIVWGEKKMLSKQCHFWLNICCLYIIKSHLRFVCVCVCQHR